MALTGKEYKELTQALVGAFPTKNALSQMLRFQLDKNLNNIVSGGNLESIVFELIQTAEAQGWLEELCLGAKRENPDSPYLKDINLGSTQGASTGKQKASAKLEAKKHALANSEANLLLIKERESEYILSADIPLQLVKEKRVLEKKIADLREEVLLLEQT